MALTLVALFVTVLTGAIVLTLWVDEDRVSRDRRSTAIGFLHASFGLAGGLTWAAYAIGRRAPVGLAGLVMVSCAVPAGLVTVVSSRSRERRGVVEPAATVPAAALAVHGACAAAAIAAVFAVYFI